MALLAFWRAVDPDTGGLIRDFTDGGRSTRFLGDLYQDLSEAARKRYALLQTPDFVEAFILDRTLDPAIREFGYAEVACIDPTCGSGHFLLGAFERLLTQWRRHEPGRNLRDQVQRALNGVAGVDLNPFAVEIARFRLLVAALKAADIHRLKDAPDFRLNLATGDSLLHGRHAGRLDLGDDDRLARVLKHTYGVEDAADLARVLGRRYHAVVGNPPYITPKDPAMRAAYRAIYTACHMKYALAAPFIERFFDLALDGREETAAGFVGLIVANSFMKREFGRKLIEDVLPRLDLTHVIDTSGAYIPGHGTPTAVLLGRNRAPVGDAVRMVMGIKGEPATPDDPARGLVWSAIQAQVDRSGSETAFVSVADGGRAALGRHPWSIGGGGASELKEFLEEEAPLRLNNKVSLIGVFGMTNADEVMLATQGSFHRRKCEHFVVKDLALGDELRDWMVQSETASIFPYNNTNLIVLDEIQCTARWLWPARTTLGNRATFSRQTYFTEGRPWWEWHQVALERLEPPLSITFAEVATHNHFVLDRGGKVFNRTAPVIKLPAKATEDDHLALLGLLNSSTIAFWSKQMMMNRGGGGIGGGFAAEAWERFYVYNSTKVSQCPLVEDYPVDLAHSLDALATKLAEYLPASIVTEAVPSRPALDAARAGAEAARSRMIALQEELDWRCYRLYGLLGEDLEHPDPPPLNLGERAFEIVMARRVAADGLETAWFARHRSTPITDPPAHWPEDYRDLVERRIALIEKDRDIGLIERPEYKRRWAMEPWEDQERRALKGWLLDRLEERRYWPGPPALLSCAALADGARRDPEFGAVAELYAGRPDVDLDALVAQLVGDEAVPFLAAYRYTADGLRKRAEWERTWDLQREEDRTGGRLDIPVPPKYKQADFQSAVFWRLRGGLDVAKERFVGFPGMARTADNSPIVTWAGYDEAQRALAIATWYTERKEREGWEAGRLLPLLAGILELLPWVKQWHNDLDPAMGVRMGDYLEAFVRDEARALGTTEEAIRAWTPPPIPRRRGRRRAS